MDATAIATDRRAAPRSSTPRDHGIVAVKVRLGHEATLRNVSAWGALVETAFRLLPGATIDLHLYTVNARVMVRASVVRSIVSHLDASSVAYCGAVCFHERLTELSVHDDGDSSMEGQGVHGLQVRSANGAEATRKQHTTSVSSLAFAPHV